MNERHTVSEALHKAVLGYFFLYFDFNIGIDRFQLSIFPAFAGWYLLHQSVMWLTPERPKLGLLERFAVCLSAWSVVTWLPIELPRVLYPVSLTFLLIELYFHFLFLTELSELARDHAELLSDAALPDRMLRVRTAALLLRTALGLVVALPLTEDWRNGTAILLLIASAIVYLLTLQALRALRSGFDGFERTKNETTEEGLI